MLSPQVPVAKEGYPFILTAAFATLIAALFAFKGLTLALLVITVFILCFFRDPERLLPENADALVSPADGKVILVETVTDPRFAIDQVQKISIFMNVFNVHVNRSPCDGVVRRVSYRPGQFYSADSQKGGLHNEYCATTITTPAGKEITFVQIAGLIARRIVCWLEPGDTIARGRRIGLIRFGSRVDVYLPMDVEVAVNKGDTVRAGESTLGFLR